MPTPRDPLWSLVSFAMPCDGPDRSRHILTPAKPITVTVEALAGGYPEIRTGISPFGGSACRFYGGYGFVTFETQGNDLDMSTGDFTVDLWIRFDDNYPAGQWYRFLMFDINSSGASLSFNFTKTSTTAGFISVGRAQYGVAVAVSQGINCGELMHLAFTVQGGQPNGLANAKFYKNGVDITTQSLMTRPLAGCKSLAVGHDPTIGTSYSTSGFVGLIDDLRITRAIRWNGPFSPPDAPMPTSGYHVRGTVLDSLGNPVGRKLRVYRRDNGAIIGEGHSLPATGEYNILVPNTGEVQVVMLDDEPGVVENDHVIRTFPGYDNGL